MNKSQLYDKVEAFLMAECSQYGYILAGNKQHTIVQQFVANGTTCTVNIGIGISYYRNPLYKLSLNASIAYKEICQPVVDHYIIGDKQDYFNAQMVIGESDFSNQAVHEITTVDELEAYFQFLRPLIKQNLIPALREKTAIKTFAPIHLNMALNRKLDGSVSSMELAEALLISSYAELPHLDKILKQLYRKSKQTFDHQEFKNFLVKAGFQVPKGIFTWF